MFATYVHDLNPVALRLFGRDILKWYGLAYLAGFIAGFFLLRYLARKKLWVLGPEKTADFIAAAAMFGVFLGGRLGYVLFYMIPKHGLDSVLADPLSIIKVWEGGMASHGGILGLMIFTFVYAKKHKVTWTGLGDGLCVVAPIGVFFGRMANFINGELYGRAAQGVAWAVKFPRALMESRPEAGRLEQAASAAAGVDEKIAVMNNGYHAIGTTTGNADPYPLFESILEGTRRSEKVKDAIAPYLETRHPSQLYEGALEGLALFAILWFVRVRFPKAPDGLLTGLFFFFYAVFRIFSEQFREPDAAMVGPLSKGQFYSLFMFLAAGAFFLHAWRGWKRSTGAVVGV